MGSSARAAVRHSSAVHREGVFGHPDCFLKLRLIQKDHTVYDLKGSRGLVHFFQLRAARALTGLSQAEVAEAAGVSVPTLKRAEAGGPIKVADETIAAIAKALERAGVEFIPENGGGAGVRLAKRGKRSK